MWGTRKTNTSSGGEKVTKTGHVLQGQKTTEYCREQKQKQATNALQQVIEITQHQGPRTSKKKKKKKNQQETNFTNVGNK